MDGKLLFLGKYAPDYLRCNDDKLSVTGSINLLYIFLISELILRACDYGNVPAKEQEWCNERKH